jgi:DNA-binding transcriptional regulator YiaG
MYKFTDGGLRNVWLENGYKIEQTPYGEGVAIQDLDGLISAICIAITRKKTKLTGTEFRYLRSNMLMSQTSLGKALGRSEQAVAMWEKSGKIPKFADTLIRVIYAAQAKGNEKVKNIIHAINDTERTVHLVMLKTSKDWQSEFREEEELCDA